MVQPADRRTEWQPGRQGAQRPSGPRHAPGRAQRPPPGRSGQPGPQQRSRARAPGQRHAGAPCSCQPCLRGLRCCQCRCSAASVPHAVSSGPGADLAQQCLVAGWNGRKLRSLFGMQVDGEDGQLPYNSGRGSDTAHPSLARLREDIPMSFNTVGPSHNIVMFSLHA